MDVIDLGCGLCFGEKYWSGFILQAKGTFCQKKNKQNASIKFLFHIWLI